MTQQPKRLITAVLLTLLLLGSTASAWAHSMYQSAVLLDFHANTVGMELQLPIDRLSISFRQKVDQDHFASEQDALRKYVLDHLHPTTQAGQPFNVALQGMQIQTIEGAPYLDVHLLLTPPAGAGVDRFTLNYDVITHEVVTHVVLVSIRSDDRNFIAATDPLLVGIIRGDRKSVNIDRLKRG